LSWGAAWERVSALCAVGEGVLSVALWRCWVPDESDVCGVWGDGGGVGVVADLEDVRIEGGGLGWRGGVGVYSCVLVADGGCGGLHAACVFGGVDDVVAVALGGDAGVCLFGGVFVGDGVEFWESLADGDAGAGGVLCDFVWGSEGAFGWEAVFGVGRVFCVASLGVPVFADSDVGWGCDALGGSGQLGSVLGACEWEVSSERVCV